MAAAGSTGPAFLSAPPFLPPSCPIMSHRCCLGGHGRKSRSFFFHCQAHAPLLRTDSGQLCRQDTALSKSKGSSCSLTTCGPGPRAVGADGRALACQELSPSPWRPRGIQAPRPASSLGLGHWGPSGPSLGPLPGSPPRVSAAPCIYHVWCPLEPTPALNPACRGPCVAPLPSRLSPLSEPMCTWAVRGQRGREAGPGAPCGARAVRGWDGWLQAPAGCHQSEP